LYQTIILQKRCIWI